MDDWIKMRSGIFRDPKVIQAAQIMCDNSNALRNVTRVTRYVMRNAIIGALVSVWGIMRRQGKRMGDDLVFPGGSVEIVDEIGSLPGLGAAMLEVGWLAQNDKDLVFPKFFLEHNQDPGDAVAQNRDRQRRYRDRRKAEIDGDNSNALRNVTRNVTSHVTRNVEESKSNLESVQSNGDPGQFTVTRWEALIFSDQDKLDARDAAMAMLAALIPLETNWEANSRQLVARLSSLSPRLVEARGWITAALEATTDTPRDKPLGYFRACVTRAAKENGIALNAILKRICVPRSYYRDLKKDLLERMDAHTTRPRD